MNKLLKIFLISAFGLAVSETALAVNIPDYKTTLALAEKGNAEAQYDLGAMYDEGKGVKQDYQQALKWYQKAAEQGYAKASFNLGAMYGKGKGVKQDLNKAKEWFDKAVEQGDARAQFNLGSMYYYGSNGKEQDYSQALEWYQKAAEQGLAQAQVNLGVMCAKGQGVARQDYAQALKWLNKAGETAEKQGRGDILYNLGVMYETGYAVKHDYQKAKHYYGLACKMGFQSGCENLKQLKGNAHK